MKYWTSTHSATTFFWFGVHTAKPFAGGGTQGGVYADVAGGGDAAGGGRPQTEEETGHGQVRLRAGSSVRYA